MNTSSAPRLALLAAVMVPVAAPQAAILFPLDGGEGQASFTQTSDGITLTVDNPTPDHISAVPNFLLAGADLTGFMNGFQFRFDADVQITSYTVGGTINNSGGAFFDLAGPNGNSLNNSLVFVGTFSLSSPFILRAGEVGTLTSTFPNPAGYAELSSITAVPEPGAWSLAGGALAAVAALYRRRRHGEQQ